MHLTGKSGKGAKAKAMTETTKSAKYLSFLADTKSNESTLNLCFTMPETFYFTSFLPSKLKNYLRPYATVALFT
jgi:hypothetical protein